MRITKGLITAAGERQRRIPLQTLVDQDGVERTVLAMLVNEIISAGIDEIAIIVAPGDEDEYAKAVPQQSARLRFIPQTESRGYAQALWCARDFVKDSPFLHLVGDHVYIPRRPKSWAARLVEVAAVEECTLSAVQATHESLLSRFGVVGGQPLLNRPSLYKVETVAEKPTPTEAEQRLIVSSLRAGYYLTFFGMHVLTPSLMDAIGRQLQGPDAGSASVSAALDTVAAAERYLAYHVSAQRYDLGPRYGMLTAQLALAVAGKDRDEVLTNIVSLLAASGSNSAEADGRE